MSGTASPLPPTAAPRRRAFLRGILASLPFLIVVGPFGMLFGVLATEAGLNIAEIMGFTVAVFAGASQFSAVQLIRDEAPTLVVLATSLAVNLRMAMYSAALTPWLGKVTVWQRALIAFFLVDQSYAAAMAEYEKHPGMTVPERFAYFVGTAVLVAPAWYFATWMGARLGSRIPPEYALDFAMPITFIAMIAPMLRSIPHLLTAFTAVLLSVALAWMPLASGVLVAAVCAMVVGALTEFWLENRA